MFYFIKVCENGSQLFYGYDPYNLQYPPLSDQIMFLLFSVDATTEENSLAKMVNDSPYEIPNKLFANAVMKRKIVDNKVCLLLYALKDIPSGQEIRLVILVHEG